MPSELKIRLDWSEMDLFGHINNVSYFKYMQASRVNYWKTIGLTRLHGNMGLGPILASTTCEFKKALQYPGEIQIIAHIDFMKNSSFGIIHRIFDEQNELAATGKDVIVTYNFRENRSVPIPKEIREAVEQVEGRTF